MSVEVKTPTRTQFEHSEFQCGEKTNPYEVEQGNQVENRAVKFDLKPDSDWKAENQQKHIYLGRKRRPSFARNELSTQQGGFRRKRFKSETNIVLPTKFLLGGNINDPLNLNSLNDEEVDKLLNQTTPQSSPIPTPVHRKNIEVTIPYNINDPLNLDSGNNEETSNRKKKRNKHKKKGDDALFNTSTPHTSSKESEKKRVLMEALKIEIDETFQPSHPPVIQKNDSPQGESSKLLKFRKPDSIVSPVIPQISPRNRRTRKRTLSMSDARPDNVSKGIARSILRTSLSPPRHSVLDIEDIHPPKKIKKIHKPEKSSKKYRKNPKFIYGNYNRYYGYRNPNSEEDHRLDSLKKEWFEGKDVLDIGCNVGHITLAIGKSFNPRKIVGMDIDGTLISAARKNIRHYLSNKNAETDKYPLSNALSYGPISAPVVSDDKHPLYPANVAFYQGDFVLENDELVDLQKEEYDVILALSLTKWIHLNSGDSGLKRFFKRIFKNLRPGGIFILEPQPWSSYKKKKKLSEEIHRNFQSIKLKPAQFSDYLLSREVGFSQCEVVDVPYNKSKGFRRPIQMFKKPDTAQSSPKQSTSWQPSPFTESQSSLKQLSSWQPSPQTESQSSEKLPTVWQPSPNTESQSSQKERLSWQASPQTESQSSPIQTTRAQPSPQTDHQETKDNIHTESGISSPQSESQESQDKGF